MVNIPVSSGQAIVVTPYSLNATTVGIHAISVTDNDTNPYTFRGSVDLPGFAGFRMMEVWTAFAATSTTLSINVTYNERTCCYVEVSTYSGVGSFGSLISHSTSFGGCSALAPCVETATLTGGIASHVLAGSQIWHDCTSTHSEGAAQTVRSGPSACQNVGGRSVVGESSDRPEVTGTTTYTFSLTACSGSCFTGAIAIDLIPGIQSQGFIQIYDSTIHSLLYTQNIIVVPSAGDSLAVSPLFSRYFPVAHVITFRVAVNSASALTVSGIVVMSLPAGNV